MAEQARSPLTRPILLIALLLPLGLLALLYLGGEQKFDRVPFAYDIQNGDTVFHTLPVFSFTRPNGTEVSEKDFQGKITLLTFFAVGDDYQSKTTVLFGNLMRTYENVDWEMAPPFQFASINTGDSLAAIQAFQAGMEADPENWWLLYHDSQEMVLKVGRDALDIPELKGKSDGFRPVTSQVAVLIDREGRVRKYYYATDLQEERKIQEDLITLLRVDYPEEIKRMRQGK